ncbi:membrane protein [Mycobacterium Phage Sunflower1121]|nr:membrane protein [Mycobacterium Phage Sunflower1121]
MSAAAESLPGDWFGLAGLAVVNIAGLVTIWLKARGTHRTMDTVREHVANSHTTNLRDDIDGLRDAIGGVRDHLGDVTRDIGGVRADVGQLRGEVRDDRAHAHGRMSSVERKIDELSRRVA